MRFFLDCEFLEDGGEQPIHLLSLALVAGDGRELHLVNRDCPVEKANAFVRENVLPHIDMAQAVGRAEMREAVRAFVGPPPAAGRRHEFWGAWASYDWVCLCGLMGRMIDLPEGWPMFIFDLKQLSAALGDPPWPRQPGVKHDALADARWHRDVWLFLGGLRSAHNTVIPVAASAGC
jgi:hypothetical protein